MKISNYDEFSYDYKSYWINRGYENNAEFIYIEKALAKKRGTWFIDVGGSFGRLLPLYYKRYTHPIIVDYSLMTLQKNLKVMNERFPNAILISANAYKLPFRTNTFNGGIMVRVLHHIEKQNLYIKEIGRVLNNGATYIQEFANKLHFKAIIRNILKLNGSFFNEAPFQQPSKGNFEGTEGKETLFYNYHPKYIEKIFKRNGFTVRDTQGVSFLRIPMLKNLIGENLLVKVEGFLQRLFKGIYFAPSIFYTLTVEKNTLIKREKKNDLKDILICPNCYGELKFLHNSCSCQKCKNNYLKKKGVWDFRV